MGKNICFVLTSLESGGLQRNANILANHFVESGHQVSICCLYSTECFYDFDESIKVLDFSSNKNKLFSIGFWKKKLHKFFITEKIDTVVSFGERCGVVTSKAKRGLDINHICRGVITEKSFINKVLLNLDLKGIDKFVFQTKAQQELFNKRIQNKGVVIPNPFILSDSNINLKGLKSKRFITIGMFDRLKQKRQDLMVEAFAEFHKKHKDYVFEMYGKYNQEQGEKMRSLIKSHHLESKVLLMGENKSIKDAIVPSRAYICASTSEGMPNAVIEALSYGIPVITSNWSGYDEIIDDDVNGLVFDMNNKEQLIECMNKLANDDALFERMSYTAIKHRIEEFKSDIVLNKWDQII